MFFFSEWELAYANLRDALGLPENDPPPKIPGREKKASLDVASSQLNGQGESKRKAPDEDVEMDVTDGTEEATKKSKTGAVVSSNGTDNMPSEDTALRSAEAAAAFIPFLSPKDLLPPKLPTKEELEGILLDLRKKALVEEYFDE